MLCLLCRGSYLLAAGIIGAFVVPVLFLSLSNTHTFIVDIVCPVAVVTVIVEALFCKTFHYS